VFTLADALAGVVLPAVVAAVVLLLTRLAGGGARGAPRGAGAAGAALAIGAGDLAAHVALRGWRGWVPKESLDWIAASAAAGLLVGVLGLTRRGPAALRLLWRAGFGFAAAWFVAGRALARRGELSTVLGEMALVAAAGAAGWSLLESRRDADDAARPAWLPPLMLTTAAGSAALAVGLSGSVVLGQLTGALAAALGGALVATRLRLAPPLLPGAAPVLALTLLGLLLAACVHASLPPLAAALLALAAVVPPPVATGGATGATGAAGAAGAGLLSGLQRLLVVGALGGAAIGIAFQASPPLDY
jgi:hypothetical protein